MGSGAAGITVRGYSGENVTGRMWSPIFSDILSNRMTRVPNTRDAGHPAAPAKGTPGDLGWQLAARDYARTGGKRLHVTWSGVRWDCRPSTMASTGAC